MKICAWCKRKIQPNEDSYRDNAGVIICTTCMEEHKPSAKGTRSVRVRRSDAKPALADMNDDERICDMNQETAHYPACRGCGVSLRVRPVVHARHDCPAILAGEEARDPARFNRKEATA